MYCRHAPVCCHAPRNCLTKTELSAAVAYCPQTFNLRDVSKVFQGITKAAGNVDDPLIGVRLWAHEVLRVFYDRLIDDVDRLWIGTQLTELTEKHFKEKVCTEGLLQFSAYLTIL